MIKEIKIQNKDIYPIGQWVNITNEKNREYVNDDDIYFYVENDIILNDLKIGDIIELDETFNIIELN